MEIVGESIGESGEAALAVKVLLGRILPAVLLPVLAAGLWNRLGLQTMIGDTLPVSPGVDPAALEPCLNLVPDEVHTMVVHCSIVLQSSLHLGLQCGSQVS